MGEAVKRDEVEGMPYRTGAIVKRLPDGTPVMELAGFCTSYDGMSFGHATTLISPWNCADMDAAFDMIKKARQRLKVELEKKRKGEPYDFFFVHGVRKEDGYEIYKGS